METTPSTTPTPEVKPEKASRKNARQAQAADAATIRGALLWTRGFCPEGVDPWDTVQWERRVAAINDADGGVVFEQRNIEIPKTWSQTATNVVVSKYFRGHVGSDARESSVRQLIGRVTDTIARWGLEDGYFQSTESAEAFRDDLTWLCLHQHLAFNSPVWFNVGVEPHPQCSACFINSVSDTMESILDLAKIEGMLFKWGSGTGTNLSPIRSSKERLRGGGTASGPVSFMRGFDAFAGVIKSGGKTRRAAKMVILDIDHPDIVEFIKCKSEEEGKAHALIDAGYDGGFNVPGGAYDSVFFQNSNNSVRVTDAFMKAVEADGDWTTRSVTNGETMTTHQGEGAPPPDGGVGVALRRSRYPVRHDDQRLEPRDQHGPDPRVESLLRVHVPQRLGVQPREPQPHEVPARGRIVRHGEVPVGRARDDHGAGDPRRSRELPDRSDRAELVRLPPARARLREPRRAPHGARPALRQ